MTIKEEWVLKNNTQIYYKTWVPEKKVIATVTFIHGLGEHCSRYDEIFNHFSDVGIKVISFDQRGFGKTARKNGILGHNEGLQTLFSDVRDADNKVKLAGVPHFIMGQSMGGGLALRYVIQNSKENFAGVIACSPLIGAGKASAVPFWKRYPILGLSYVIPNFAIANPVKSSFLSRNLECCNKYDEDPDVHPYISFGTAANIVLSGEELALNGWENFKTPILISHGSEDVLTCPIASKRFIEKVPIEDKEFWQMDGWLHELHNELECQKVFDKKNFMKRNNKENSNCIIKAEYVIVDDGFSLYFRYWIPKVRTKATLTFVHGYGEHISRYDHFFSLFSENGIKVGGYDQRGFGKTVKLNGIYGHNYGFENVLNDISLANERIREKEIPHFVMGHSMGGGKGIVLRWCIEYGENIQGCIVSAPLINFGSIVPKLAAWQKYLVYFLANFFPTYNLRGEGGGLGRYCTRDAIFNEEAANDPFLTSKISLDMFSQLLLNNDKLLNDGAENFNIPVLCVHGTSDVITCPNTSEEFIKKVPVKDKEYFKFDGYYHELHNEIEYEIVAEKYIGWILERSK
ncbi:hypothetical protein HDU92_004103 [Lobulomyces angularis]|nr:hypothetical protein HDU92_004103 [Lobulomyces angularis]